MVGIFTHKKLSGDKLLTITNYSYMFDKTHPYLNYFLFTNPEDPFSPLVLERNRAFADLRYKEEDSISPITLIFPTTESLLGIYILPIPPEVLYKLALG